MKDFLIDPLKKQKEYRDLLEDVGEGISPIAVYGLGSEDLGHIIYALKAHLGKKILLITENEKRAKSLYEDMINLDLEDAYLFPKKEILFYDIDASSAENSRDRIRTIVNLLGREKGIFISSVEALADKMVNRRDFQSLFISFQYGKEIDLEEILEKLVFLGYKRGHMVEEVGQFSLRGGILDIFPADSPFPYRIELFDTEIDSIRTFDYLNQRSIENKEKVVIPPMEEILLMDSFRDEIMEGLKKDIGAKNRSDRAREKFSSYMALLEEGACPGNRDMILPYFPKEGLASLLDFVDEDSLVVLDSPNRLREGYKKGQENRGFYYENLLEAGEIMPSHFDLAWSWQDLLDDLKGKKLLTFSSLQVSNRDFPPKAIYKFDFKSNRSYDNRIDILAEDLRDYQYRGYKVLILSGKEEEARELVENLAKLDIVASFEGDRQREIKSGQVFVSPGSLSSGFEYPRLKFVLISHREIFGREKKRLGRYRKKKGKGIINLNDLEIGSYIVHENHGIGKYEGIEQLEVQGIRKDYLMIAYKGADKLYIPIDQMNLIQKYVGSDSMKPKISRLNSGEWQRTMLRAQKAVEDMAEDLLNLYAKRENFQGHAFSPDSPWQRQFEDSFPYEETEGQIISLDEIKKDMEEDKPMDRLLCGDVGYGKTEVALRAAFKAIMDGKQVAILVPTTILAQQHYKTMEERFEDFPIERGVLSRFRSPREQKKIIDGLRTGTIDIVVGTHRLLSEDVSFKNLGLLIVDEEQRFGVKHKERLKLLKENVDVLTLTATPIPRTLHMSLAGIRDMSLIEDPPAERYPIQTYVLEYNPQMVREAILKEMARGGQVYFVYNRVDRIERMALQLRELVPEARITIGHGQMGERQLEKVMMDFIGHEYDVLISTTIIETGLDISNVNTLIVYNADRMGLAQLYQLRGRVGRTNKIAYGYFTYEKDKVLSELAEKRLRAIKEFTEFGSGFKIAMRDLEIRGAGNLLGAEQHGHIGAIGYDLYVKFLGEAIRRLKGEEVVEEVDTSIDIDIDGFIPLDYIENEDLKIDIYKKIAGIGDKKDYDELMDELVDRFGDLPRVVENLMDISYIKALSGKNGISEISERENFIKLDFLSTDFLYPKFIHALSLAYGESLSIDLSSNPHFKLYPGKDKLKDIKDLLVSLEDFRESD